MFGRPLNSAQTAATEEPDRRAQPRTLVACPVRLVTISGHQEGEMRDLSLVGAQVAVPVLPAKGSTVMLRWREHERMASVIWAKDGVCGLSFDRPLTREILGDMMQPPEEPRANARLHQIQPGARRASFLRRAQD